MIKLSDDYRETVKNILRNFKVYHDLYSNYGTKWTAISALIEHYFVHGDKSLYSRDYDILSRLRSMVDD